MVKRVHWCIFVSVFQFVVCHRLYFHFLSCLSLLLYPSSFAKDVVLQPFAVCYVHLCSFGKCNGLLGPCTSSSCARALLSQRLRAVQPHMILGVHAWVRTLGKGHAQPWKVKPIEGSHLGESTSPKLSALKHGGALLQRDDIPAQGCGFKRSRHGAKGVRWQPQRAGT